jgi:hypothetical protein
MEGTSRSLGHWSRIARRPGREFGREIVPFESLCNKPTGFAVNCGWRQMPGHHSRARLLCRPSRKGQSGLNRSLGEITLRALIVSVDKYRFLKRRLAASLVARARFVVRSRFPTARAPRFSAMRRYAIAPAVLTLLSAAATASALNDGPWDGFYGGLSVGGAQNSSCTSGAPAGALIDAGVSARHSPAAARVVGWSAACNSVRIFNTSGWSGAWAQTSMSGVPRVRVNR